ncbi:MAG: DUF748 domain-containing protein [Candidatus Electrothrix sp. ATG2]|nr:DUF748 domain-containing protein [Candidatus Electrothrix sp. ATG2]
MGELAFQNLDANKLQPYLAAKKAFQLNGGKAHLVMQVNPRQKEYQVKELTLEQPRLVLTEISGKKASTQLPLSVWPGQLFAPTTLPVDLAIKRLTINKGTLQQKQKASWKDLQLELTNYRNRESVDKEQNKKSLQTTLSFSAQQAATTVRFQGTTTTDLDLTGELSLHNLDASKLQPYLGAKKAFQLDGGKAHLVMQVNPRQKEYQVEELTLEQPQLVLIDISGKKASTQLPLSVWPGQVLDLTSLPFKLAIHRLTINKGTIQKAQSSLWKDLELELTGYHNQAMPTSGKRQKKQAAALSFSTRHGVTTLRFQGKTTPDLSLSGKISLHKLDASLLQPYLGTKHALRLTGGKAQLTTPP